MGDRPQRRIHVWHRCHACGAEPIVGWRFECQTCPAGPDATLCEPCYAAFLRGDVRHPDIRPTWNLLVGFPGEPASVYRRYLEVLPLLTHLMPPNGVFPIRFDRFSPYHTQAKSYGLELRPMDFYSYVYPFGERELHEFAYYFSDDNLEANYVRDMLEWIQPLRERVAAWQTRWTSGSRPVLSVCAHSGVVRDSRGESAVERRIDPLAYQMLQQASRPLRDAELIGRFAETHGAAAAQALASLDAARLLFREDDRVLSLVADDADAA